MADPPLGSRPPPPVLGAAPMPEPGDIIPRVHLSNLIGNSAPVLALISDSTGLPGSSLGGCGQVGLSQCLWAALKDGFRRQNPLARFNFDTAGPDAGNFAIGGAGWLHMLKPGGELKLSRPAWFADAAQTWLGHVERLQPDILVFNLGINFGFAGYGSYAGQNVLHHIAMVLAELGKWAKTPNVIVITNKTVNEAVVAGPGSFNPAPAPSYLGVAAALRTLARSSSPWLAAGAPGAPRTIGLIDIGRHYARQVLGRDPANQYLAAAPPAGRLFEVTPEPVELGWSDDGDFAFTLLFPAQGSGTIHQSGVRQIQVRLGPWAGQVLTLQFQNAAGQFRVKYSPVHPPGSPFSLLGESAGLATGDFRLSVEFRQERLTILLNGGYYLSASVPRLICAGPITLWSAERPARPPRFAVASFHGGRALPCRTAMTEDAYYGAYGTDRIASGGPYGGNNINHPASLGVALTDYPVIAASNLAGF